MLHNPFSMPSIPTQSNPMSANHGAAEQWAGTVFANAANPMGITPPASPRRTTTRSISRIASPRQRPGPDDDDDDHRDRERESRRRAPSRVQTELPTPDGFGARLLAAENRIRELAAALIETKNVIEFNDARAHAKIGETIVNGKNVVDQIERSFPERFHNIEVHQSGLVDTINGLTKHLQDKVRELEESIRDRPTVPPGPQALAGLERRALSFPTSAHP